MNRILCIVGSMNTGGAETFLMKIYRNLDKKYYQMDFIVSDKKKGFYDNEIFEMGGKIFFVPPKSKRFFKSFIEIKKIVRNNNYNCVIRVGAHSLAALDLLAAKFGGAKKLILRSSNANLSKSFINKFSHYMFKFLPLTVPNIKIAPSSEAAIFTFNKRALKNGKVKILKNGIPYEKYKFNIKNRNSIRKELGIETKTVVGHIGRFVDQKNHLFLIDIFNELLKKIPDSILLLVGSGDLENNIKTYVKKLKIEDKVLFLGIRDDIPQLLSAMDIFIFPSLYEGMPNTIIEAQASGLHCLVSDSVTRECNITGNVEFLSLKKNPSIWAEDAIEILKEERVTDLLQKYKESGYDIDSVILEFTNLLK